jgi:hypothetical protein
MAVGGILLSLGNPGVIENVDWAAMVTGTWPSSG